MKYIALINKKQPITYQLNAIAHAALGLGKNPLYDTNDFSEFLDREGNKVSFLTDSPFIILSAKNGNQLRTFHKGLIDKKLPNNAFFIDMIEGGDVQSQIDTVKKSSLDQLEYVAVLTYGENQQIDELTKKFSLYRN